jgi:hypothetical protein
MSIVDLERLAGIVEREKARFASATPFPHLVIDDLLDADALRAIVADFDVTSEAWTYWHHVNERKRGLPDRARMSERTRAVVEALETPEFLRLMEELTGVDGLLADPHLDGGGLHEMLPGGFLNVHTDFLSHTIERSWRRELNLLLFLNEKWVPEHAGWLELWDASMSECARRIEPRFNRCVVFRTSATSFHGVPSRVACPAGDSRKSLALYYFRDEGRPLRLRPTHYVPRPQDTALQGALIRADRLALRAYSFLKRYTPFGDAIVSKLLRRL